ncbi:TetR/AcrR family transcriptional regulator [Mediterraneibacter sp. NSJ-55]|uniref:TetR/AcrR family transcriptional regulator n=1 Tax=Mediterraneibacter hominis TaxID=2763054 RepID=A0A923RRZ1_9FIRM|nr:TetR/AcrR family transcriptional regulator [Mediterraneibacter hominis]MBC5688847.1 TetR/AcrR family transcriptional regulator [Mediterraneibacter hominis]
MNLEKEIISVGIKLFKKYGYDNTTINMICEGAKISKGTFYYHFQGKHDIIYGHIETFMSDIVDVFPKVLQLSNPKEQLWELYKYSFEHIVSMNPQLLLAFYKADIDNHLKQLSPSSKGTYQYHTNSFNKMILALVKKCQEADSIKASVPAENLVMAFDSAIVGTGLDWACNGGKFDEVERLKNIFETIFTK